MSSWLVEAQTPPWGPWVSLQDGSLNNVKISFRHFTNGTLRYKIRNDYDVPVKFSCSFRFTYLDGHSGKDSGCDGTLNPGQEKTDPGWFDFSVREVDISSLAARVTPSSRSPESLIWATCDPGSDVLEEKCNMKKVQCNQGAYSWCEARFGTEGTQKNRDNRAQYDRCVSDHLLACSTSLANCKANIRRCIEGEVCDAHTSTCTVPPTH